MVVLWGPVTEQLSQQTLELTGKIGGARNSKAQNERDFLRPCPKAVGTGQSRSRAGRIRNSVRWKWGHISQQRPGEYCQVEGDKASANSLDQGRTKWLQPMPEQRRLLGRRWLSRWGQMLARGEVCFVLTEVWAPRRVRVCSLTMEDRHSKKLN